jgi:hypothetical protein
MASTSAPFGFRPSFHNSGQIRPKAYVIASGYATSVFSGDPVKLTVNGVVQLGTSDGTRSGTVAAVQLLGIFAGCQYLDSTGKPTISPFWTGSTATYNSEGCTAWVYDDPETIYDVQYTNPGTPGTTSMQVAVGQQCDWVVASPGGSNSTGISSTQLSAIHAGNGQFQITGFQGNINDSLTDAYAIVTVRLNEAQYKYPVAAPV